MTRPRIREAESFSVWALTAGGDDDAAVVDSGRTYTHGQVRVAAARLAGELLELGLPRDARIALVGGNSFFWVAAYFAAMQVGTVVPLSEKLTRGDLRAQAEWAGCSAALVDRRHLRQVVDALPSRPIITDEALASDGPSEWPIGSGVQGVDAALMFTSGTTSRPKAVRVTHRNLASNTSSIIEYLGLRSDDRMCVILPFHYVFGASLLHTHLAVGGSVALCNTFAFPETALNVIDDNGCTGFAGVPSSYQLLLRASSFGSRRLGTLRHMQQAGGRLGPEQVREVAEAQPDARLFVMYGQTEATARLSYLPPEMLSTKRTSIGRGIPGVTLSVLDRDGNPVAVGEQGEIVAAGENISPGYFNDPEATAVKFRDGRLLTGDLATVDEDGYIHITGRQGEFIKSWGHRISPQQIEEATLEHPGVASAVVVGLPDPMAGEAVTLAVTATGPGIDSEALLGFLRERLAKHMVPVAVHVLAEIPLTSSGKVARAEVRNLLLSS